MYVHPCLGGKCPHMQILRGGAYVLHSGVGNVANTTVAHGQTKLTAAGIFISCAECLASKRSSFQNYSYRTYCLNNLFNDKAKFISRKNYLIKYYPSL